MITQKRSAVGRRLLSVLRSRRVLLALATLIAGCLVALLPELEAVQDDLLALVGTILLAIAGDYTVRDGVLNGRSKGDTLPTDVQAKSDKQEKGKPYAQ